MDALAGQSSLTKGYLSLVERGHKVPTIASLVKVAGALEVPISVLFEEEPLEEPVAIVRRRERKPFQDTKSHHDYSYESITFKSPHKHMEAFIMVPPVTDTDTDDDGEQLYDHEGEELIYVVSGAVELILADRRYSLRKGDCCYLDSSVPHTYRSKNGRAAECLTVIYPVLRESAVDDATRPNEP